jgi:probable rRNA maturation factor
MAKKASDTSTPIQFNYFRTRFRLGNPKLTTSWLQKAGRKEGFAIESLSYVFCTDSHLLSINQQYLKHDTLTDIITFDLSDEKGVIEGEIYISVPRVRENAKVLGVNFDTELHRVIVHGLLHLCGHSDKTNPQKAAMRKRESAYLSLR